MDLLRGMINLDGNMLSQHQMALNLAHWAFKMCYFTDQIFNFKTSLNPFAILTAKHLFEQRCHLKVVVRVLTSQFVTSQPLTDLLKGGTTEPAALSQRC